MQVMDRNRGRKHQMLAITLIRVCISGCIHFNPIDTEMRQLYLTSLRKVPAARSVINKTLEQWLQPDGTIWDILSTNKVCHIV
jgi:hypothetical protein